MSVPSAQLRLHACYNCTTTAVLLCSVHTPVTPVQYAHLQLHTCSSHLCVQHVQVPQGTRGQRLFSQTPRPPPPSPPDAADAQSRRRGAGLPASSTRPITVRCLADRHRATHTAKALCPCSVRTRAMRLCQVHIRLYACAQSLSTAICPCTVHIWGYMPVPYTHTWIHACASHPHSAYTIDCVPSSMGNHTIGVWSSQV
jgi:hypothetical protein